MKTTWVHRRQFLLGAASTAALVLAAEAGALEVIKEISDLKPGEFTWHPDRQPSGPVAIVVSLPEQRVHVYRNGIRIAASTCSSGRPGHETPTGVFVVLQKDKHHRSSTYSEAPMPNMNRLTWSGIALHAGDLPGYPASHGCVRLPLDFSAKLFDITHLGTPVIIAGSHADPWDLIHPGMVLSGYAETEFSGVEAGLGDKKHPADWTEAESYPIVSVIASSADRQIMLIENGDIVATGSIGIKGSGPLGSQVFVLQGADASAKGMRWSAITYDTDGVYAGKPDSKALSRISADKAFVEQMRQKMHPGMIMILTDIPLEPDTRSGKDFVIMS
jgi:hypothetical protein